MRTKAITANAIFFFLLFTFKVKAQDSSPEATRCQLFTESISNMQQDQLNMISPSCQSKQPLANNTVSKIESICSFGYLQKKYNALQAETAIYLGLRKLNQDVLEQFEKLEAAQALKIQKAVVESKDLSLAVKRVNTFHGLLQSPEFKNLVKNSKPGKVDFKGFCQKNSKLCRDLTDIESKAMVLGFINHYQKKLETIPPEKKNVEADFALFDSLLIKVPTNETMADLEKQILVLKESQLTEEQKKSQFEKIQASLDEIKKTGIFQSKENTEISALTPDNAVSSSGHLISLYMLNVQKNAVTTASIELLIKNIDPPPASSDDIEIDLVAHRTANTFGNYKKLLEQSAVDQNVNFEKNLRNKIQKEIDEVVKDEKCPGDINQYNNISSDVYCQALFKKHSELVKARDFAGIDRTMDLQVRLDNDYKKKLVELECLSPVQLASRDVLQVERKSILLCLREKAKKDGEIDLKLASNNLDLEEINKQIQEIYGDKKYRDLDALKYNGIQLYLKRNCGKTNEGLRTQQYTKYFQGCGLEVNETPVDVLIDSNQQVVAQLNEQFQSENENGNKDKKTKRNERKQNEADLLLACADPEVAARSGIVCAVVKKKDENLKSSEKQALDKSNYNYEFVDGVVVKTPKQKTGNYISAGVVNAMGTAVNSFRNYQNTRAVTNMYQQSAAYSAYAEYNQQNLLYWQPQVPANFTSPYLYTGAPLGSINPYSTNFNYNNNSFYYNTSYDPLTTVSNGSNGFGGSGNAQFGGFN